MSDDIKNLKHKIDPDQPDAHRFEDKKEIFFQDEFEEALTSICEHVARLDSVPKSKLENINEPLPDEEKRLLHRHSTISIFGQRGVGKTSFLLTIKDAFDGSSNSDGGLLDSFNLDLELEESKKPKDPENLRDDVQTLDSIDPSLIENADKLLVTITSTILDHVRGNNDGDLSKNQAIQDALEDLSRRFRVLFSDATDEILRETASDPLRFAGEVLFDADSGPKLAQAFHRFLALAAEDLGVKCFLLPIDDVDTSFDKGWPLLETLRKYLATDRLITVVSGDLEFFDLIVQQEAHKRTRTYRKAETEYQDKDFSGDQSLRRKFNAVRRFPEQYLQKIFPSNSRVRIPDIQKILFGPTGDDLTFKIVKNRGGEIKLSDAIKSISFLFFGLPRKLDGSGLKGIFSDEINEPTDGGFRNIQTLKQLSDEFGSIAIESIVPSNTRRFVSLLEYVTVLLEDLTNPERTSSGTADRLRKNIAEMYSGMLRTSGLDISDLEKVATGEGNRRLSHVFFNSTVSAVELARLKIDLFGDHESYEQLRALLTLVSSALYADWLRAPTGPIRYMTKVRDALTFAEERDMETRNRESELDTLGVGLSEPSWKSRCRLLKEVLSSEWDSSTPDYLKTTIRIQANKRDTYSDAFMEISPENASVYPDYLRWWRAAWNREKEGKKFKNKRNSLITQKRFSKNAGKNANIIKSLFLVPIRRGQKNYRYIDFRRGLARIDDLLRENIRLSDGAGPSNSESHSEKSEGLNDLRSVAYEPTDFVLRVRGSAKQKGESDPSEEDEEPPKHSKEDHPDQEKRVQNLDFMLSNWIQLAEKLTAERRNKNGDSSSSAEINMVPPPWTVVEAYERFLTNCGELADDLKWRQNTVGTMLERYTLALWNSLLRKEIQLQEEKAPEDLVSNIDFGLVRDDRRKIVELEATDAENPEINWTDPALPSNSFTRNIKAIRKYITKTNDISVLDIMPYTLYCMLCPTLLTVVSKEVYDLCVHANQESEKYSENGLMRCIHRIADESSETSYLMQNGLDSYITELLSYGDAETRPGWQRSSFSFGWSNDRGDFDIHDILCGVARADDPPSSADSEEDAYFQLLGLG